MKGIAISFLLFISTIAFGQNQNISNGNVFDGEPYLAINPNNTQHIIVAWMGYINFSDQFKIKTKTSFDGGQTWSPAAELPHTLSGYTSADPSIDFDQNGDAFVCYIDFTGTTPPATGGVYICKSIDGGLTWNAPMEVINTNFDGTKWPIDRPWLVIDTSSGPYQGNMYVTTMNLNRTNAPYNPYISISNDGGTIFTSSYLDTVDWLAGSVNPIPMCSPTVSSSGVFYGAYPSYVVTQSFYTQVFLAKSNDGGLSFSHSNLLTENPPSNNGDYPLAKKGPLLISNPSDANHLAYIFLSALNGDLDVFLIESFNAGASWSAPLRINDDPMGNNKMQDLVWADFDTDGDLIVSWRDRRNGGDSTYQTPSEIWAAYRNKDSLQFSSNFQITNQTVAYDSVLARAGNDFMSIKMQNDTLNAAWGDTRNGKLNIWFQSMSVDGTVLSVQQISSENIPDIFIYPNPTTSTIFVENENLKGIAVYDINGREIILQQHEGYEDKIKINLENYPIGTYLIKVETTKGTFTNKIIKQ